MIKLLLFFRRTFIEHLRRQNVGGRRRRLIVGVDFGRVGRQVVRLPPEDRSAPHRRRRERDIGPGPRPQGQKWSRGSEKISFGASDQVSFVLKFSNIDCQILKWSL